MLLVQDSNIQDGDVHNIKSARVIWCMHVLVSCNCDCHIQIIVWNLMHAGTNIYNVKVMVISKPSCGIGAASNAYTNILPAAMMHTSNHALCGIYISYSPWNSDNKISWLTVRRPAIWHMTDTPVGFKTLSAFVWWSHSTYFVPFHLFRWIFFIIIKNNMTSAYQAIWKMPIINRTFLVDTNLNMSIKPNIWMSQYSQTLNGIAAYKQYYNKGKQDTWVPP